MSIFYFVLIGILAGYLAGKIMEGRGFGLGVNLLVGIGGAIIGGWLLDELGIYISSGLIGSLITALIGAIVLLFIINLFRK